jgi:hypothetical protein
LGASKLFRTIVLAILTSVAIIMGLSQATGYNLYTGDELQSHVADRVRQSLDQPTTTSSPTPSITGQHKTYDECVADPDTTIADCAAEFPGE